MSAIIKTLQTKTDNGEEYSVYPKTVLEAVVDSQTNKTLDAILADIENIEIPDGVAYIDPNSSSEIDTEAASVTSARLVSYSNAASGIESTNVQGAVDELVSTIAATQENVSEVGAIAKGKNRARVFNTTDDMNAWLKDEANKGVASVGDNLYIVDVDVPDWWVSAVLSEADASTGMYYNIAQLETQKVDLTTVNNSINNLDTRTTTAESNITNLGNRVATAENNITNLDTRTTKSENDISYLGNSIIRYVLQGGETVLTLGLNSGGAMVLFGYYLGSDGTNGTDVVCLTLKRSYSGTVSIKYLSGNEVALPVTEVDAYNIQVDFSSWSIYGYMRFIGLRVS